MDPEASSLVLTFTSTLSFLSFSFLSLLLLARSNGSARFGLFPLPPRCVHSTAVFQLEDINKTIQDGGLASPRLAPGDLQWQPLVKL